MAKIAARLPRRADIFLTFAWCLVVLGSWSVFAFLQNLRGWLFYLSTWDIVGLFAYPMVFCVVEASVLCGLLVAVTALAPFKPVRRDFPAYAAVCVIVSGLWAFWGQRVEEVPAWPSRRAAILLACYTASVVLPGIVLWRFPVVAGWFRSLVHRFSVLLVAYVPLVVLSVIVIIIRNLG